MSAPRHAYRRGKMRTVVTHWILGLVFGAAVMTASTSAMAQEASTSPAAIGWLSVEPSSSGVLIVGHVLGLAKGEVKATMTISRSGKSGSTRTSQSNDVSLEPGKTAALSRTGLSFAPGDRLDVELTLSSNGRTISKSRVETGG